MLKKIVLMLTLLLLTGCVKQPDIPAYTISKSSKVGYLIQVKQFPIHTHIGTTIFNNFSKVYKYDWKMGSYIEHKLITKLSSVRHLKPINLSNFGFTAEDLNDMIIVSNGKWIVNPEKEAVYNRLTKMNIKALVVIYDDQKIATLECGAFGCTPHYAKGYGVFTRSILNLNSYMAATAFYTKLYLIKPPVDLSENIQSRNENQMPAIATSFTSEKDKKAIGFKEPKDFYNLTRQEMAPFEFTVKNYINERIEKIAYYLNR